MGVWTLIDSEDTIKEKAKTLKKQHRGHYYSNCQFFDSGINNELEYSEMYYAEEAENLYVLKRHDDFYKLLYCVGGGWKASA